MNDHLTASCMALDKADYGVPPDHQNPRDMCLWIMWVMQDGLAVEWLTAHQIEELLISCLGIHLSRQKIQGILMQDRCLVLKRKKGGVSHFKLLRPGIEKIRCSGNEITVLQPGSPFTSKRSLQSLFDGLAGEICVCDPYAEPSSLDVIAQIGKGQRIRFLTRKIHLPDQFKRDVDALCSEGLGLEVRKANGHSIHDRYAIDKNGVLVFGASLNSVGHSQSLVMHQKGDIRRALLESFDGIWSTAIPL